MADLTTRIRLTADVSQLQRAAEQGRRALLEQFAAAKQGAADASVKLAEAQRNAQALDLQLRATGVSGTEFDKAMGRAAAAVRTAKQESIAQAAALNQARAAAQANAAAIAAAAAKTAEANKAAAQADKLAKQAVRIREEARGFIPGTAAVTAQFAGLSAAAARSGAGIAAGLSIGARGADALSASLGGTLAQMKRLAIEATAIATAVSTAGKIISAGAEFQRIDATLRFATGSAEEAADALEFVRQTAQALGQPLDVSAKSFAKLSAAARGTKLEGEETRKLFTALSGAARVTGLTSAELEGALMAVQQMISKGTVSAEELRGQLGERLPGAFQIAARAMGVTTQELGKLLEQGQVSAVAFLPKFAEELQRSISESLPGAVRTFDAELARLKNALLETGNAIAQSGALDAFTEQIREVAAEMRRMAESGELKAFASDLADGFRTAAEVLGAATRFVIEHREAILTLVEAYVALRAIMIGAGIFKIATQFAQGIAAAGGLAAALGKVSGGLAAIGRAVPGLVVVGFTLSQIVELLKLYGENKDIQRNAREQEEALKRVVDSARGFQELPALPREKLGALDTDALKREAERMERAAAANRAEAALRSRQLAPDQVVPPEIIEMVRLAREQETAMATARELLAERVKSETPDAAFLALIKDADGGMAAFAQTLKVISQERKRTGEATRDYDALVRKLFFSETEAGKAQAERIKEGIEGYKRLSEALRGAMAESRAEAEQFRQTAKDLRAGVEGIKESTAEKVAAIEEKGMTPEQQAAAARRRSLEASVAAEAAYDKAVLAKLQGKSKEASAFADQAQRAAEKAQALGVQIEDARIVEDAGTLLVRIQEERARAAEAAAVAAEQRAASQAEQLAQLEVKLAELKKEAASFGITIKTDEAIAGIQTVSTALDAIKDKTVTVTVNTVKRGEYSDSGLTAAPAAAPKLARGGRVRGPGTSTSDSILARLSAGEFVVRASAVRHWGEDVFDALNALRMPQFAAGGIVERIRESAAPSFRPIIMPQSVELGEPLGELRRFNVGGVVERTASAPAPSAAAMRPLSIHLPGGETLQAFGGPDIERQVERVMMRAALRAGARK